MLVFGLIDISPYQPGFILTIISSLILFSPVLLADYCDYSNYDFPQLYCSFLIFES